MNEVFRSYHLNLIKNAAIMLFGIYIYMRGRKIKLIQLEA